MGLIIAGVDGSAESQRALAWAADESRVRDTPLRAVYIYQHTPAWEVYGYGYGYMEPVMAPPPEGQDETRADASKAARELVERMVAELDQDVQIEVDVREDRRPAHALVELSEEADMLVVGSRGRGGFAGLLLGSVSQQCVQHARCPVVIVPAERE